MRLDFQVYIRHIFKEVVSVLYIKRNVETAGSRNFIQFSQKGRQTVFRQFHLQDGVKIFQDFCNPHREVTEEYFVVDCLVKSQFEVFITGSIVRIQDHAGNSHFGEIEIFIDSFIFGKESVPLDHVRCIFL